MKFLRRKFDSWEKYFAKGTRLEALYPLYEVIDAFLYSPNQTTSGRVHIRDAIELKRLMISVVIALVPVILMTFWNTGYQISKALTLGTSGMPGLPPGWRGSLFSLMGLTADPNSLVSNMMLGALYFIPLYIITNMAGGFWEILFSIVRKKPVNEGFLVTGILFPLILPPEMPLWMAALGISFGVVLGKEVFGGTGMNFINVALVSRVFLFFAYPSYISGDRVWVPVDGYTQATALGAAASGTPFPFSFADAFLGFIPGSMGETSALACILGAAYLLFTRVASSRVIMGMLLGFSGVVLLLNQFGSPNVYKLGLEWHLVSGGFAFGAAFMVTDPVTSAMTDTGRWIYGAFCGAISAIIRIVNPAFPEGVMLGILLGNIFAPLIDYFIVEMNKKRRVKRDV